MLSTSVKRWFSVQDSFKSKKQGSMSIWQVGVIKNFLDKCWKVIGRVVCQFSNVAVPFFDWLAPPLRLPSGASVSLLMSHRLCIMTIGHGLDQRLATPAIPVLGAENCYLTFTNVDPQ